MAQASIDTLLKLRSDVTLAEFWADGLRMEEVHDVSQPKLSRKKKVLGALQEGFSAPDFAATKQWRTTVEDNSGGPLSAGKFLCY